MVTLFRPKQSPTAVHDAGHHGHSDAELKAAYERGRREERARHKRSPFMALALVAVALIGGTSLALAAYKGSFSEGGALMDRGVSSAAREAVPTLKKGAAAVQDTLSTEAEPVDNSQPAG
ncbi:hypothetical protein GVN21_01635 [Caulobacter sp. SLTY]|uniref:hypothetical protein n=1 Tax=Caulobacter sp. SLTY TaxID=2683262 RepID=UPI001412F018|nr:hypothetical protein [Caulobacter sp. SLTY]NBB14053.1 hypothetical protein [Caulobacter sp. SLTY]